MLTKEERAAIAYRIKDIDVFNDRTFYTTITGKRVPEETSYRQDLGTIAQVILDLCDTSNMIELPLDKDDKVIHVGDVVYVGDREFTVHGFIFNDSNVTVRVMHTKLSALNFYKPNELTHKRPVTIESLVERFKRVLEKGEMSYWAVGEICDIVDQLEKLGDSDAN